MGWTNEQQQVIDSRNSNLLVAAAAGSGKTAVLVERLVGRVVPSDENKNDENLTDIDRMLVVTFTRDAAAELRERVAGTIDSLLEKSISEERSKILSRQKTLLSKSYITTIDSFCMDVVKQNFVRLGIDPSFSIGDNADLEILADDVLSDLLEEYYAEKSPAFLRLANTYVSKRNDDSFKNVILKVYEFAQNDVNPSAWIEKQREFYADCDNFNLWTSVWGDVLTNYFYGYICDIYEVYLDLQQMCITHDVACYKDRIDLETEALSVLIDRIEHGDKDENLIITSKDIFDGKIGTAKGDNKTEYSEMIKKRRSAIITKFRDLHKSFFSDFQPERQMKVICEDVVCLCELVQKFSERFIEQKHKIRTYSFPDIAHFALDLLVDDRRREGLGFVPTDIARRYQSQFDEIYIDEYQDTSMKQEILLGAVAGRNCGANNVFMVGDIKQSIYAFRYTCPEFFLEKYNRYEERECDNRLICLYKNFRSRKNIVNGVNDVFSKIMKKATADMDYTEKEYLNYGAVYYDEDPVSAEQSSQKCELVLISDKNADDAEPINADKDALQARYIAGRILKMVSDEYLVYDKSKKSMRPVEFRDFVILMRNAGSKAPAYIEVFSSFGIPVFAPNEKTFFSSPEIATILSYLKIIDNPHQDIPLMSVMRSPLHGFTDSEIAEIKARFKYPNLYKSCELFVKGEYDDVEINLLKTKIQSFLQYLSDLRIAAGTLGIYDLIWLLVNKNDFYNKIGLYKNGENSQANIRLLLDMAVKYDNGGGRGLFSFIRRIQRLENEDKGMEQAAACSEDANVVRIKTIHKSKGLEYPVVFLSGTSKSVIDKNDTYTDKNTRIAGLLLHRNLGINPMCYERGKYVSVTYSSVMRDITEKIQEKEQIAEEMRLLYVAITRAREKFIAVGIGEEKELFAFEDGKCNAFDVLTSPSYKKWLTMSTSTSDCWIREFKTKEEAYNYPEQMKAEFEIAEDADSEDGSFDLTENNAEPNVSDVIAPDVASGDSVVPVKISVSDVKRLHAAKDEDEDIQDLLAKKQGVVLKNITREKDKAKKRTFTPAQKGTLTHTCLQLLDFSRCKGITDENSAELYLDEFLDKMTAEGVFDNEEANAIERKLITKFILSDIGKRIFNSDRVYRETPFTIRMRWNEITGQSVALGEDEFVSVQGVIDCFIVEDDGCVVIDYKTDYLRPENAAEVNETYKIQLKCYSDAIEKITGRKVKESVLVYLRNL